MSLILAVLTQDTAWNRESGFKIAGARVDDQACVE